MGEVRPVQFDDAPQSKACGEKDNEEGRIASALRSLGLEPTYENITEVLSASTGEIGNCEFQREPSNVSQHSACRQWATERLRKKREKRLMRSSPGTPVASADGKTPCSSRSTCALPSASSDFMGVDQMIAKSSSSKTLAT